MRVIVVSKVDVVDIERRVIKFIVFVMASGLGFGRGPVVLPFSLLNVINE